ncbi:MAG: PilZ domain-containing protein [Acidobacteriia bacterium]|nr:PilZ domain-containing protein [Terriglobia bacterium]
MGRRQQKRLRIALPVTVSGLDSSGNPFTQSAATVEISPGGVRLRGVRCLRNRGDPVQVEYQGRRGHYRVAWIGQKGTCWEGLAGLEGLEGAALPFAEHLPAASFPGLGAEADPYADPAAAPSAALVDHAAAERRESERRQQQQRQEERRRHPRFNCAGVARIWENGQEHAVDGRLNEISLGGCYVEMMSPVRVGTGIRMELAVNSRSMGLQGIVRTSQPTCGMGVEFTKIAPADAEKLHRVVAELSGEVAAEPPPPAAPDPAPANNMAGQELSEALLRWFGLHDTLTRRELLNLIAQLKHVTEGVHPCIAAK